jgi:hypothetical protein
MEWLGSAAQNTEGNLDGKIEQRGTTWDDDSNIHRSFLNQQRPLNHPSDR